MLLTVHLLRYEDFINNTIASAPLCAILSGNRNVDSSYRRVFRSGSSGAWRHFLTDSDVAVINETCEPFLRRFNYPFKRVRTLEKPSRATGSGYVEKLIDEARGQFESRASKVTASTKYFVMMISAINSIRFFKNTAEHYNRAHANYER